MSEAQPAISPVMDELSSNISSAVRRPLPAAVVEKTKHHVLDTLAAMISGSRLPPGRRAISFARSRGGADEACIVRSSFTTSVENAALANAMLAHSDETDDSHAPSQTHPGCGVVPAALAMAERGGRNGVAFLRAVALGYDVGTRLTMSLNALEFRSAGHATHAFGSLFGAAAAAGARARLDQTGARHLISFTAQQASGLGSWTRDTAHVEKAFVFGGMPARNGVAAAAMVGHGFSAVEDVLAGEASFFAVYGREPDPARLVRGLGTTFEIMNTNIKRWSGGSPIQAPLDSLLELIRAHDIEADDVERLVVRVSHTGANTTNDRSMPDISMQHMCALMLTDGSVTFASSHDEARMNDPAVVALRRRVELHGDDELQRLMPSRQGIVEVRLKDGREYRHHTAAVRGTAENPMARPEVDEKCFNLIAPVLGKRRARTLCDTVWRLESVASMRDLRPLLMARKRGDA